jgi:regulation of enolase protein 1 (concanavalin A-like superfamily)
MDALRISALPAELHWRREPKEWKPQGEAALSITAPEKTDLFVDPGTGARTDSAPAALFIPPDAQFLLSARVEVAFGSTYDAGVLHAWVDDDTWAKLCFEFSPQRQPMVVSVVNRGVSDDSNSAIVNGSTAFLRVTQLARATAFHWSPDGERWSFVRYFSLGKTEGLRVGFSSQSPTGPGCRSLFSQIRYRAGTLADLRNGD